MNDIVFTDKERKIACYNDGKSGDRYTVVFLGFPEWEHGTFQAVGRSLDGKAYRNNI